jgi:glutathione S-transferase
MRKSRPNEEISGDTLRLYNWPTSTCSQKVRLVLAEKGLEFEDVRLNPQQSEHLSDWYLKLNPNGVVPTLTHGPLVIIDSSVIAEYIDEVFREAPLSPSDAYGRAKMRAWRQFIDEVPTAAIRVPSYNGYIVHLWKHVPPGEFEKLVEKRTIRRQFYRELGQRGSTAEKEHESIEMLRETIIRMDKSLRQTSWIVGEQFTLADIALVPTLIRMSDIGLGDLWKDFPTIESWLRRVQQRPSFQKAFYEGSRFSQRGSHPAIEAIRDASQTTDTKSERIGEHPRH